MAAAPTTQGSRGASLDAATRAAFEPRFGLDLGTVRVHTSGAAAEAARRLSARAFTVRDDIVFAPGEYQPRTERGRRLIAHELAHVAQRRTHHVPIASVVSAERDAASAAERERRRMLNRGRRLPIGPPRYWDWDRTGREGDSPTLRDRATTESIVTTCVADMRPRLPEWYDVSSMGKFDCHGLYGVSGQFDFRGRVMDGWEANYYFVSMAMAHQGYDWSEAQAIIIAWNGSQSLGINPYGGGGDMTDEMWFAAHEGFSDEQDRMLLGR